MIAHKDGRFACRDCADTVRPGAEAQIILEHRGKAKDCQHILREPSPQRIATQNSDHVRCDPMSDALAYEDNYGCNGEMFSYFGPLLSKLAGIEVRE